MSRNEGFERKLWTIHSWVGLYAGVVIAILSLTGVLALYKVELDHLLNPCLFKSDQGKELAEISDTIESLKAEHRAEYFSFVGPPSGGQQTWMVRFFVQKGLAFEFLEFFIDPYTGTIIGERDYTYSFTYFLRNLHVRLYESLIGRQIVGIAGIALLISTITGFWIYGGFMKKQVFAAIRQKNLKVKMADYHKLIGISTLTFNLMIAISGAWLGLQVYLQPIIVGDRPGYYEVEDKPLSEEEDINYPVAFEAVIAKSKTLFPALKIQSIWPSKDGSRSIRINGDVNRTAFERNIFSITLDKKDLSELYRYDIREASVGDILFYVQESLHFGDFGGILLKVLYSFFGISSGFLSLTGFIVYLKRKESNGKQQPRFVELQPQLLRWTFGILGGCLLLGFLQLNFGVLISTIVVIVALYSLLLFLSIRALVLYIKSKRMKYKTIHVE